MRAARGVILLALAVQLVWLWLPGTLPVSAQDQDADLREAVATAEEIFRLAAEGKYNAMYDRIHPDAHAVVPRAAAVGTFTELYAIAQAGRSQITGARMVSWTYPVTGQTYPYAAEISFVQPYVENGQERTLEDTMYLVESNGEWRWFFGASPEFVEAAIARYGGRGSALTEGDLLQNVVTDLDTFYTDALSYTEFDYRSPGVILVEEGDSVRTGCGAASSGFWAFYCPNDQTVYLDDQLLTALEQQADFAAAFVIAHEWAHHVQTDVGIQRAEPGDTPDDWNELYSVELELMADCMSGAWALDVDSRGLLETDDVDEAIQFTIANLGDPQYISEYDPQAHGSADQRVQSFLNGYENGFLGCNVSV
jgi:predicted metalloprotease